VHGVSTPVLKTQSGDHHATWLLVRCTRVVHAREATESIWKAPIKSQRSALGYAAPWKALGYAPPWRGQGLGGGLYLTGRLRQGARKGRNPCRRRSRGFQPKKNGAPGSQESWGRQNVTDWTGGQQPGFSSLSYVLKQKTVLSKKIGSADSPPPPGGARSAEAGLPSTRNWSFRCHRRWPLPLISPLQVIPKAMRAASWPWWRFLGVGCARL
jgi:hypothetical protein